MNNDAAHNITVEAHVDGFIAEVVEIATPPGPDVIGSISPPGRQATGNASKVNTARTDDINELFILSASWR
ncbi:hypothetical protein FRC03_006129 [Tulasnella sp. 419]|nr:hypothetical protein FRC03_006129 [Tulasnella sp. 419]